MEINQVNIWPTASQAIASAMDGTRTRSSDYKIVNGAFRNFYTKLFQSEQSNDVQTFMEAFL